MLWIDKMLTICIVFNTIALIYMLKQIKAQYEKSMDLDAKIRVVHEDTRHINMITERMSTMVTGLKLNRPDITELEAKMTKLQDDVKSIKETPVKSPLPELKVPKEKPYVKIKY